MKEVKLGFSHHSNRSTPNERVLGSLLKKMIKHGIFEPDSAAAFLQRSLILSFSERTYGALPKRAAAYAEPELHLEFQKPRCTAVIPNLWQEDQYRTTVSSFLSLRRSFHVAANEIFGDILKHLPQLRLMDVLRAWEAVALDESNPLMVSYIGSRFAFAVPEWTDLAGTVIPRIHRRPTRHPHAEEELREYSHLYEEARREKDPDAREALLARYAWQRAEIMPHLSNSSQEALKEIDKLGRQKPSTALTSLGREARALVAAASLIRSGSTDLRVGSPERLALSALADFLTPGTNVRRKSQPKRVAAIQPSLIFANYGLDRLPIAASSLTEMALRIAWSILVYCGRRASCLLSITLADFHVATDLLHNRPWIDLQIDSVKSRNQKGMRLPLSLLMPGSELRHVRDFLATAASMFPGGWKELTLLELIGGRRIDLADVDKCGPLLKSHLGKSAVQTTHLPRITFATWLPLRIICARDPELMSRSSLDPLRDEIWFGPEMLMKMAELVGNEATDSLEIVRRILGHSTSYEFIASYCRGWSYALRVVANL